MHPFPPVPHVDDAPAELLESGHLWILEAVAGAPLRFRLLESGLVEFGDADRVYANPEDLPPQYGHAVRHVRETLDREALRAAVDDIEAVVFFGQATQYRGVDYDWDRMPSFLGTEIWAADTERFRPPDAVDGIFERLGLDAITPIAQEVRARDFDPETYDVPDSAWYDGPAAGVVIRDKSGHRGRLPNPGVREDEPVAPVDLTAVDLANRYGSHKRLVALRKRLLDADRPVTVDALLERSLKSAVRELDPRTFETGVDRGAFRSELASRIQRFLNDRS